ncbi:MAG: hypothetical protein KC493_16290, partial [Bacteriovoracaceae bacterium]|nr:hypothetical protein [Bacteriovoracaceae bacterium]
GGAGGAGGIGRVRLDDSDGVVAGSGTAYPSSAVVISSSSSTTALNAYESDISFGCGTIEDINNQGPPSGGLFIFLLVTLPFVLFKFKDLMHFLKCAIFNT